MSRVVLYSRARCGLCDRAREVIRSVAGDAFEEISIDRDEALEREYGIRIPVVLVDGVEEFEIEVEAGRLRALLRREAAGPERLDP